MFVIVFGAKGEIGKIFCRQLKQKKISILQVEKNDPEKKWRDKISKAQWIILATPIESTPVLAQKIAPLLQKEQIISDFTSIKNKVIPILQKSKACIISAHPMFGKLKNIQGQKIILLPVRCNKEQLAWNKKLYQSFDLKIYVLKQWKKHDSYMSTIQALLHFSQISLVQTLRQQNLDIKTLFDICSPIYKIHFSVACRILLRNPNLYSHILMDNPHNLEVLENFLSNAQKQLQWIKQKNKKKFIQNFQENNHFLKKNPAQVKKLENLGNFLIQEVQKSKE